jgi:Domain of unknown function (DUF4136)
MGIMTKIATFAAAAVTVAAASGCAGGMALYAPAGRNPEASRYVTFFVQPGNASDNPELDRQLRADVVTALIGRGMVETSPEVAEAVVIVNTATPARRSGNAFYQGWGGWAWRAVDDRPQNSVETYDAGSVVVDIFDAWSKTLVWHGSARHAVSGDARSSDHPLQRAVDRLFGNFPAAGLEQRSLETAPSDLIRIIFSPRPTFLVRIDGRPRYVDVAGTELRRITNANALIVRDDSGMHYLRLAGSWLEAYDVTGDWSPAGILPDGADLALQDAVRERRDDPLASVSTRDSMPDIVVALTPAELIVTDGEPDYASIQGTSLQRITNTTADVFREPTDEELYVRLPAGWFRAWTTNGPWQRIADDRLPADLARLLPATY